MRLSNTRTVPSPATVAPPSVGVTNASSGTDPVDPGTDRRGRRRVVDGHDREAAGGRVSEGRHRCVSAGGPDPLPTGAHEPGPVTQGEQALVDRVAVRVGRRVAGAAVNVDPDQ